MKPYVVPITVAVLLVLFSVQRFGTSKIGVSFGPIMVLWFVSIFLIGLYHISLTPTVLEAINPSEGFKFFIRKGFQGWVLLGAVVLCVTGAEAMFADLGHCGKWPVRFSWMVLVYPSILFNYIGQGAMLIKNPEYIDNPFFRSVPNVLFWPMLILATLATIIASQALISGSFSVIQQAIPMKLFPKVPIIHTSPTVEGQIYIPVVNYLLAIMCIILVVTFKSSAHLAGLYGLAVCGNMVLTSIFFGIISRYRWNWYFIPWALLIGEMLLVDICFLSATLLKVPDGAWFTLLFASLISLIMLIWRWGKKKIYKRTHQNQVNMEEIIKAIDEGHLKRFDRIGVFLSSIPHGVPISLSKLLEHSPFLHSTAIFLTIKHSHIPFVPKNNRIQFYKTKLTGCYRIVAYLGYRETDIKVPQIINECQELLPEIQWKKISYFLGIENVLIDPNNFILKRIVLYIFEFLLSLTNYNLVGEFQLPPECTISLGQDIVL
jgi:KUP system potassium uptake protein